MLADILTRSESQLPSLVCCKSDGTECNCIGSLSEDYRGRPDSYNCTKKLSTYVLRYGPAYTSEIYHYLEESNFQSKIDVTRPLNITSLGCGFAPDYIAIKSYLAAHNINQAVHYKGLDNSTHWHSLRPNTPECTYQHADLTLPFDLKGSDVVIISKLFSTLYRNGVGNAFLTNLRNAALQHFRAETLLVFIDVNHVGFGRDCFHHHVSSYLPRFNQYYFDGYAQLGWSKIDKNDVVFDLPEGLSINSLPSTGKTIVFDYKR